MSGIHLATISFGKNERSSFSNKEEAWNLSWSFVANLYKNGNILDHTEFFTQSETSFVSYVVVPDKDALTDDSLDKYALEARHKLEEKGVVIAYEITARHVDYDSILSMERNIKNVGFLYLHSVSLDSHENALVLRTDKGKYLPIYMIKNNDDPYLSEQITFWQNDCAAVSRLWLSSYKKLEPIMAKQLANLDSDITTKGRDLSKRIEKALKKKVFYPIAELVSGTSNKHIRSNHTQCPSCHQDWKLETTFCKIFDFKCDKCLLLGYDLTTYGVK